MRKVLSYQKRLFIVYSIFVTVMISMIFISFFLYFQKNLKQNTEMLFAQTSRQISLNLDSFIQALDTITTQVASSKAVQQGLVEASATENLDNYFDQNLAKKNEIAEVLSSINSTKDTARNITVLDDNYNFVAYGKDSFNITKDQLKLGNIPFFNNSTKFVLLPPYKNQSSRDGTSTNVIALVREINGTFFGFKKVGTVMVLQDYQLIEQICATASPDIQVIVLNQQSDVIYPFNKLTKTEAKFYSDQLREAKAGKIHSFKNSENQMEMASIVKSDYSTFTVILLQSQREFMKPVYVLRQYLLVFGILLGLITVIFIYVITKSVTSPIRKLKKSILNGSFENQHFRMDLVSDTSSVVNEIELLHRAFMKMFTRINNATNEIIQARSSEAEAHFLALQAQMNPHFLYNSLMCISAAGQEIGSQKIKLMCAQLSDLLRYVTSIDNNAIKIRDELNHAELYLQFIKWRYEERFDYSIHVDERILDLHVPKLIIQPLLENCLNHGLMKIRAPWRVEVSGIFLSDHHWVLEIKDNGNGFQDDELELIRERLLSVDRSLSEGKLDNRLEVGGMGLMNIYTRMKLIYKETAVFELYNHAAGGAVVKIGNEEEITK